jgi:hypothetical protein
MNHDAQRYNEVIEVRYYDNILDLPLQKFIECQCKDNLYALVISGDPTKEQLQMAWIDIQQQYCDAIGNNEMRLYLSLQKEIAIASLDYSCICNIVNVLRRVYYRDLADELIKLIKMKFRLDPTRPEEYFDDLQRILNRSKSLVIKMDLKKLALEAIQKKLQDKGQKPTREYYERILITISNHAQYSLNRESITVFEFCERLLRFNQYYETIKNKLK